MDAQDTAEVDRRALAFRRAGVPYERIALELGLDDANAARLAVIRAMEPESGTVVVDEVRLEVERIDALLVGLWDRARRGDDKAIDRVLKLMDHRARLAARLSSGTPGVTDGQTDPKDPEIVAEVTAENINAWVARLSEVSVVVEPAREFLLIKARFLRRAIESTEAKICAGEPISPEEYRQISPLAKQASEVLRELGLSLGDLPKDEEPPNFS